MSLDDATVNKLVRAVPRIDVFVLVVLFAGLLCGATRAAEQQLPKGVPEAMEFSFGVYLMYEYPVFSIRDGTVIYEQYRSVRISENEFRKDFIKRRVVHPTPDQWKAFARALEKAHVTRWTGEYTNPNAVDGTWWSLKMTLDGKTISAKGSNSYPAPGNEEKGTNKIEYSRPFFLLLKGVDIIAGPRFANE